MTDAHHQPVLLPAIAGYCIDCAELRNIIQQGPWEGFCSGCATDGIQELRRLEATDAE